MIAVLIVLEHRLVKPDDLSRIDMAFFHVNSAVSVILFAGIFIETFF
jgi:4-hydroxybenzoate polyprenyltransferase